MGEGEPWLLLAMFGHTSIYPLLIVNFINLFNKNDLHENDVPGYPFDFNVVRDAVLLKGSGGESSCSDDDSNSNDEDNYEVDSDF